MLPDQVEQLLVEHPECIIVNTVLIPQLVIGSVVRCGKMGSAQQVEAVDEQEMLLVHTFTFFLENRILIFTYSLLLHSRQGFTMFDTGK
ncbi:hypothetical protein D3C72_2379620 [compost metagenome]